MSEERVEELERRVSELKKELDDVKKRCILKEPETLTLGTTEQSSENESVYSAEEEAEEAESAEPSEAETPTSDTEA